MMHVTEQTELLTAIRDILTRIEKIAEKFDKGQKEAPKSGTPPKA